MNRNCTGNLWLVWLLLAVALGCDSGSETAHEHSARYTCPMHPQIVRDRPGSCPICGMDLVTMATGDDVPMDSILRPLLKATNKQVISDIPTVRPQTGTRIVTLSVQGKVAYDTRQQVSVSSRVAGRIERVGIRYNFQPVRKGQLLMEIYSPELAAAQRELMYIHQQDNNPALRQGVRQKLRLLGMTNAQIDKVIQSGKPLYRVPVYSPAGGYIVDQSVLAAPATEPFAPAAGGAASGGMGMNGMGSAPSAPSTPAPQVSKNTAVLIREGQYVNAGEAVFTIYKASGLVADFYLDPALAQEVKRGQKVLYTPLTGATDLQPGFIGLVEPVQRGGDNFAIARMYLRQSTLYPGQLLRAEIPVVKDKGAWLPQSAVVGLGASSVIFKKEGAVFEPKHVQTGLRAEGLVHVLDDIAGWRVARSASYLVDSESFIRAPADF